jgi:hypothetical protein
MTWFGHPLIVMEVPLYVVASVAKQSPRKWETLIAKAYLLNGGLLQAEELRLRNDM